MRIALTLAVLTLCAAPACQDPAAPGRGRGGDLLVTGAAGDREVLVLDAPTGAVLHRMGLGAVVDGVAPAPDGTVLYIGLGEGLSSRSLVAIDVRRGVRLWQKVLPSHSADTVVQSTAVMVVRESGDDVYLYSSRVGGVLGIARFNLETASIEAFAGPFQVAGMVPLRVAEQEYLAVMASRRAQSPRLEERIFLLDPVTLAVVDSVMPAALGMGSDADFFQVIPADDERSAYIVAAGHTSQYRFQDHHLLRTVGKQPPGLAARTANGTIVRGDGGVWPDSPGSGHLWLYTADLEPIGTIDVSTPLGGQPYSAGATATGVIVASSSGSIVYVRVGTPDFGPLYPPQRAGVLSVSVEARQVVNAIWLGGYGRGFLCLMPEAP